jgi:uncharacterized protein (DUF1330 family)
MKKYGGTPIDRGGKVDVAEGEGRVRNIVIEFASFDAARTNTTSPEYAAARKLREMPALLISWWLKARLSHDWVQAGRMLG